MLHLIPAIIYIACVQGHHQRQPDDPYLAAMSVNNDRTKLEPLSYYPEQKSVQATYVAARQNPDYSAVPPFFKQSQNIEDPFYNSPSSNKMGMYRDAKNLRQTGTHAKLNQFGPEVDPFDLDGGNNDSGLDVDRKSFMPPRQSYFEDLELVENFGNYLKKRTQLDRTSPSSLNNAAYQYNALLSVLMALARVIRNSCTDFNQVYNQVYLSTVDTYYRYGLTNADKVPLMIEEYIRKGYSHMPRIRKLKQELCNKEVFCSASVDNIIKSSQLLYVKELETLEALAHLARSYYLFMEEFNQAAQTGSVLPYLQNNKDRLREYVMQIVNSVEHLSDKPVLCS